MRMTEENTEQPKTEAQNINNLLDEMMTVPDSGTYDVVATVRETPRGSTKVIAYSQYSPEEIRNEVQTHVKDELENAPVGQSVVIRINVDNMTYTLQTDAGDSDE